MTKDYLNLAEIETNLHLTRLYSVVVIYGLYILNYNTPYYSQVAWPQTFPFTIITPKQQV